MDFVECELDNLNKKFHYVKVTFNYKKDKQLIDAFIQKSKTMIHKLNSCAAQNIEKKRTEKIMFANAFLGIITEHCWKEYLNQKLNVNGIFVRETEFISSVNQIDLVICFKDKKITGEVRSSYYIDYVNSNNEIKYAVLKHFDILGPYSNSVKKNENLKDIYLRALIYGDKKKFEESLFMEFSIYLVGGATKELLLGKGIMKKLITPDDLLFTEEYTEYLVISPISEGLDILDLCVEIKKLF